MKASLPAPRPLATTENTKAFVRRVLEVANACKRVPTRRDWLLQLLEANRLDLSSHLLQVLGVDHQALRDSLASTDEESDPWLDESNGQFISEEIGPTAREVGHEYIGTEHILLAFTRAPGPSGDALRSGGVTWDRVLAAFNAIEWAKGHDQTT